MNSRPERRKKRLKQGTVMTALCVQFPCCPCGGSVYVTLLQQRTPLPQKKEKKSEGREVVIFNTLLFAFTRRGPVMCKRESVQRTGSQTTNAVGGAGGENGEEEEEEEVRAGVDLSGRGSGQCSGHAVQERKVLAQAHLTRQHTSPRSKHH